MENLWNLRSHDRLAPVKYATRNEAPNILAGLPRAGVGPGNFFLPHPPHDSFYPWGDHKLRWCEGLGGPPVLPPLPLGSTKCASERGGEGASNPPKCSLWPLFNPHCRGCKATLRAFTRKQDVPRVSMDHSLNRMPVRGSKVSTHLVLGAENRAHMWTQQQPRFSGVWAHVGPSLLWLFHVGASIRPAHAQLPCQVQPPIRWRAYGRGEEECQKGENLLLAIQGPLLVVAKVHGKHRLKAFSFLL